MKIKLLLLLIFTAAVLFAGDILRINKVDDTWLDFEISNIAKLTFSDYKSGDILRVNNPDGTWKDDSIGTVDRLRFSDWYGFLAVPQNLTILAGSSSVSLDWTLVDGAEDYLIYRSNSDPYSGFVKIDSTITKPYIDNSVLTGNKYFYLIKARNSQ